MLKALNNSERKNIDTMAKSKQIRYFIRDFSVKTQWYLTMAILIVFFSACGGKENTPPTTGDFSLTLSTSSLTVLRGGSANLTVTVNKSGGFSDAVRFEVTSALPNGVSASFNPQSDSDSSVLTIKATSLATLGSQTVKIKGTSTTNSNKTYEKSFSLTVNNAPEFNLTLSTSSLTVSRGSSADVTVTINKSGGFSDAVAFQVISALPGGVTAVFNPPSSADSSVLTLSATATAALGTKAVTISGSGGGKTHTASFTLTVEDSSDFGLTLSPTSLTVPRGSSGNINISVNKTGGFSEAVSFAITSTLPSGVTYSFNPPSHPDSSILTLNVSTTAALGDIVVTISGSTGGKTHTASFTLTVNNAPDTTKPTIVHYSPADGSRGNLWNTKIIIQFSEPMNQLATKNAFTSTDLGPCTFRWSADGKIMTVTPNNPLQYSPNQNYKRYHFSITTTAKDKAGNNLAAAESAEFSTLRTFIINFRAEKKLDGHIWSDGTVANTKSYIVVGDRSIANHYSRGFLSFKIGNYLNSHLAVSIKKAKVIVYQYTLNGHPYHDLKGYGNHPFLNIYHVNYGSSLDSSDFNIAPILGTGPITLSTNFTASDNYRDADVTAWVAKDYMYRTSLGDRTQFRLQFAKNSDGDNHSDNVGFYSSNFSIATKKPTLRVEYYRP